MNVLLVMEDEREGRFLARALDELGARVRRVHSGAAASDAIAAGSYAGVVMDGILPDGWARSLIPLWRQSRFSEPIIVLCAHNSPTCRVSNLSAGADDCVSKPTCAEELLARIRRQILVSERTGRGRLEAGVALDLVERSARVGRHSISLTQRECMLLDLLLRSQGRVVTRTRIAEHLWNEPTELQSNVIDVHVRHLRRKLAVSHQAPVIRSVRGVGYSLLGN